MGTGSTDTVVLGHLLHVCVWAVNILRTRAFHSFSLGVVDHKVALVSVAARAHILTVLHLLLVLLGTPNELLLLFKGHGLSIDHLVASLHLNALHLDQILHVVWLVRLEHSVHVLQVLVDQALGCRRLRLHLEFDVVEDAVEADRVQLDRHFDCWVLLEVDHWLLVL